MEKYKILFVDDDDLVLKTAELFLNSVTTKLTFASSGKECLDLLFLDSDYDLVLLDCMLPDIDGLEVLSKIREHDKIKNIPVILQTGMSSVDHTQASNLKASVLYKPYSKQELYNVMQKHIRFT